MSRKQPTALTNNQTHIAQPIPGFVQYPPQSLNQSISSTNNQQRYTVQRQQSSSILSGSTQTSQNNPQFQHNNQPTQPSVSQQQAMNTSTISIQQPQSLNPIKRQSTVSSTALEGQINNNFQKLNKQSTILYLHNNPNSNAVSQQTLQSVTQQSTQSQTFQQPSQQQQTISNQYLQESNNNDINIKQNNAQNIDYSQSSCNYSQIQGRGKADSKIIISKERLLQEKENNLNNVVYSKDQQNHNTTIQNQTLNVNQSLINYQQTQLNNRQQQPNMKKGMIQANAKMCDNHHNSFVATSKGGINRVNSQEKLGVNVGKVQQQIQQQISQQQQENLSKNRPQTSYRMATKNSFQGGNSQQMNNNINQSTSNVNQSCIVQQQDNQNNKKDQCSNNNGINNKENDGMLSNIQNFSNNQLTNNKNLQKQLNQVSQIQITQNDFILKKKDSQECLEKSEIERETQHVTLNYGEDIDQYQRELEVQFSTQNCLIRHKITPALRSRMVDWMIEVLTNFKCDDQTFFLGVSILDRFFKAKTDTREISDLHIIGVTAMFIASKYEDIYPLKMKMVHEKIAHKKLSIEKIKSLEMDILKTINYRIPAPTSYEFLKVYLKEVLGIGLSGKTQQLKFEKKEQNGLTTIQNAENTEQSSSTKSSNNEKLLIEKMALYLSKMSLHDYELSGKKVSLQAVGSLYVALKICEQLKKTQLITNEIIQKLVSISKAQEEEIIEVSQRILYLAQNFEKAFPGLENLKKTHFLNITQLI